MSESGQDVFEMLMVYYSCDGCKLCRPYPKMPNTHSFTENKNNINKISMT